MKKSTVLGSAGSVSGLSSMIGSAQACHNICVSGFSTLSAAGAAFSTVPLFLQKAAIPFWLVGITLYVILLWLFVFRTGVKHAFLLFNGGILLAGFPFITSKFFFAVGALLAVAGLLWLLWGKFSK